LPHARSRLEKDIGELETLRRKDAGRMSTRIELDNYVDLQYLARISAGSPPQEITSVIDTGSYDLVIFERGCRARGCGNAVYSAHWSSTNKRGRLITQLTYGSGDVYGDQAFDMVSLGNNSPPVQQEFWQIGKAHMPVLAHAAFQSIMGVGPPETPAADSWTEIQKEVQHVLELTRREDLPHGVPRHDLAKVEGALATAMDVSGGSRSPILRTFGVRAFSICIGGQPGSKGYLVWNDTLAEELPTAFVRLAVVGKHSWTVKLSDARLSSPMPSPESISPILGGCETGCTAAIDSGTSLILAPVSVVTSLDEAIASVNKDCDSLEDLPSLVLTIDGHDFILPPDAYAYRSHSASTEKTCRLKNSVTVSMAQTDGGPLWILGIPFMRRYYTTFHVGKDLKDRSFLVAPSNGDCNPKVSRGFSLSTERQRSYLRTYDPEAAYITPLAYQASTQPFVRI